MNVLFMIKIMKLSPLFSLSLSPPSLSPSLSPLSHCNDDSDEKVSENIVTQNDKYDSKYFAAYKATGGKLFLHR